MLVPKQSVRNLSAYALPEGGRMDFLRLDFNENTQGASPKVLEALRKISAEECGCYPEYDELKQALARYLDIDVAMILPTNGSDEALKLVFDTFVERGDKVLLIKPGFSMVEMYASLAEAQQVFVSLEKSEDFAFPIDKILAAIEPDTKLLIIATPNNPTGTSIAREDLVRIIEKNPHMAVLIDEAYSPFAKINNLDLALAYNNVLVAQTFSKGFGLAGLRIAYVVSQSKNIDFMRKVISPYSVNRFAVTAALAAIEDVPYINHYVEEVILGRETFLAKMKELGFKTYPSQANFVLTDFGQETERIKKQLRDEKILVREKEGLLRISFGTLEQTKRLIEAIDPPKMAIIFDMDGVLIDESMSYRQCIKKTVEDFLDRKIDLKVIDEAKKAGGCNDDYDCVQRILQNNGFSIPLDEIKPKFDAYYEIDKANETWLVPDVVLRYLKERFKVGIFTGRPKKDALDALQRFNRTDFFEIVVTRDDVEKGKPDPEGLLLACEALQVTKAIYIGDNPDDALAAQSAGCLFIPVSPATKIEWILSEINRLKFQKDRQSKVQRQTKETSINLQLNLDGKGKSTISTGIGFFDHMLEAFSKHSCFDIQLECQGDLYVDQHHTVEDVGIVLGEAYGKALNKMGIARTGFFAFPMDESLAICSVDISNRPSLAYNVDVPSTKIGDFDTVNLPNFFAGFVQGALVNLHMQVPYGKDPHHMVEAIFKAFGKALRMACALDEKRKGEIPSTKGVL